MSHNVRYILDNNLIVAHAKQESPAWSNWVRKHIELGNHLYVLPRVRAEYNNR